MTQLIKFLYKDRNTDIIWITGIYFFGIGVGMENSWLMFISVFIPALSWILEPLLTKKNNS